MMCRDMHQTHPSQQVKVLHKVAERIHHAEKLDLGVCTCARVQDSAFLLHARCSTPNF